MDKIKVVAYFYCDGCKKYKKENYSTNESSIELHIPDGFIRIYSVDYTCKQYCSEDCYIKTLSPEDEEEYRNTVWR